MEVEEKETREKESLISATIPWFPDLKTLSENEKEVRKDLKEKLISMNLSNKESSEYVKTFMRLYYYLIKTGTREASTVYKGNVYVCKVDVFEKDLVCLIVPEDRINEYSQDLVEILGGGLPKTVEYEQIFKTVWTYEFKQVLRASMGLMIVFVLVVVIAWGVNYYLKEEKKKKREKLQATQTKMLTPEETSAGRALAVTKCLDHLHEKLKEYVKTDGVRVRGFSVNISGDSFSVSCNLFIDEEYSYPAKGTVLSGKYYRKDYTWSTSLNKRDVQSAMASGKIAKSGNFRDCVEKLAKLGFVVTERRGGMVKFKWERKLSGRQAFLLPEVFKGIYRACGFDFDVNRLSVRSSEIGEITLTGEFTLKEGV
jgi:hypothetical protein